MMAMGQLGLPTFAAERRLDRDLDALSPSPAREGLISKAHSERAHMGHMKQRTEATEACARKIVQSGGRDWDSIWTLTQESCHDETETVCQNCYVGGSGPRSQKDAFHNLLTGVVRHWMGEDYWGDWTVDQKKCNQFAPSPDIDGFTHIQQPLQARELKTCSMVTTKL